MWLYKRFIFKQIIWIEFDLFCVKCKFLFACDFIWIYNKWADLQNTHTHTLQADFEFVHKSISANHPKTKTSNTLHQHIHMTPITTQHTFFFRLFLLYMYIYFSCLCIVCDFFPFSVSSFRSVFIWKMLIFHSNAKY